MTVLKGPTIEVGNVEDWVAVEVTVTYAVDTGVDEPEVVFYTVVTDPNVGDGWLLLDGPETTVVSRVAGGDVLLVEGA